MSDYGVKLMWQLLATPYTWQDIASQAITATWLVALIIGWRLTRRKK